MPISPTLPTDGQSDWDVPLNAALTVIVDEVNAQETDIAAKLESVDIADINATGTPSGTTYLRGDGTWSTPAGGGGGAVDSVNGATGVVVLDQDDVGDGTTYKQYSATEKTKLAGIATGATANSSDATLLARANHTGTQSADTLTDGTTNKAFLATERTKLTGIATSATANDTDANLKARANHTGTQAASTISDFATTVRATTGSDTAAGSLEVATSAETITGTDAVRATTPAGVKAAIEATPLHSLANVAGTPADGQALVYDSGTSEWKPETLAGGGGPIGLDDLTDVDLTSPPSDGDVLTYDSGSGDWVAAAPSGGGAAVVAKAVFPAPNLTPLANMAGLTVGKGQRVMTLADCQVTSATMWITGVAGKTYRLGMWEMAANGTTIAAQVGSFVDVASPGDGRQQVGTGAVAWDLDAGKFYTFTVHVTDGTQLSAYGQGATAQGSPGMLLTVPPANNGAVTFAATPAVAVSGTMTSGSHETWIIAQI